MEIHKQDGTKVICTVEEYKAIEQRKPAIFAPTTHKAKRRAKRAPNKYTAWTNANYREVWKLKTQGHTIKQIAKTLGRTKCSIYNVLSKIKSGKVDIHKL